MADNNIFLAPKLEGRRFDDHTLPVNMLEDFSALEELIVEVAKKIFLEENPNRKRVPKGFTDNISLKLTGIEKGSAIPQIAWAALISTPLFGNVNPKPGSLAYFEKARDRVINAISNANTGQSNDNLLDQKNLNFLIG